MIASLKSPLRRELKIGGEPYVVTISPEGMKLVLKGKRKGYEMQWPSLVNGDAALAVALNASLDAPILPRPTRAPKPGSKRAASRRPRK